MANPAWIKGVSGNPKGRPKGSNNRTLEVKALMYDLILDPSNIERAREALKTAKDEVILRFYIEAGKVLIPRQVEQNTLTMNVDVKQDTPEAKLEQVREFLQADDVLTLMIEDGLAEQRVLERDLERDIHLDADPGTEG